MGDFLVQNQPGKQRANRVRNHPVSTGAPHLLHSLWDGRFRQPIMVRTVLMSNTLRARSISD